jgi:hypothetical protein
MVDKPNDEAAAKLSEEVIVPTMADYITVLHEKRKVWEEGSLRASHNELYGLLGNTLLIYEKMVPDTPAANQLRYEFDACIKEANLKFSGETHTVVKLARVVFNTDAKQGSAYGQVLRIALNNGVTSKDLPDFIRNAGGIEALRTAAAKKDRASTEEKASQVWQAVQGRVLAKISSDGLSAVADHGHVGKPVVLVATQRASGIFEVHGIVKASGIVNAAYAAITVDAKGTASTPTLAANTNTAVERAFDLDTARKAAAAALLA